MFPKRVHVDRRTTIAVENGIGRLEERVRTVEQRSIPIKDEDGIHELTSSADGLHTRKIGG